MSALTNATKVTLPEHMAYLSFNTSDIANTVQTLVISSSNAKFKNTDGVLYTKDGKNLLVYPMAKTSATFTLPSEVSEIGYRAFYGAKNLTTLKIGSVVTIRDNAFESSKISKLEFSSSTASVFAGRDILLGANTNLKISVPSASLAAYKANVLVDYSILDKFIGA
jgi:hypothetical protein